VGSYLTGILLLAKQKPHLLGLDVRECKYLTDTTFQKHISKLFPHLRKLNVRLSCISDEGLKQVAIGCPELTHLDLSSCIITSAGIEALVQHCHNLQSLDLHACLKLDEKVPHIRNDIDSVQRESLQ
jgi:hypothetical protein